MSRRAEEAKSDVTASRENKLDSKRSCCNVCIQIVSIKCFLEVFISQRAVLNFPYDLRWVDIETAIQETSRCFLGKEHVRFYRPISKIFARVGTQESTG